MFKIGEGETKISVTTWKGAVRVHFTRFFQSKLDRKKFYPSLQGIALTVDKWTDLKSMINNIDEVVTCSTFILDEMKQEEQRGKKISYNRQLTVVEVIKRNLQMFSDQVVNEIIQLRKEECEP